MTSPQGPTSAALPPETEAVLRRLEYVVRNKLDGLLQGSYLGLVPGPGSEAGESRQYYPGDDVRRMDWPVTARTMTPHVRQTVADRELETWLVVDLSPSLDFGTANMEKRDLVFAAATAMVHLTTKAGNRIGAIVTNGDQTYRIPAVGGINHARYLLRKLAATPRADHGGGHDLRDALEQVRRPPRRRGMVAVISDFLGAPDWERPLRGLGERHELLGIEIVDPREMDLPAAGLVTFVDPESGEQLEVQTSDAQLRYRYAVAAREQRASIATMLRRAGADHLQLRTDSDWLSDMARFVVTRRRGVAARPPSRAGMIGVH
ncbi:DUF58 domain-containing protein [Jatrophihabitans telluris]|uniref:DUF58 domain-containing protein n=1 Tax=Jatrophihabitans telluris TaxID=2038343 RepID=A0ABY4R5Q9_9ACTN|nr:DUF58 domain-containing protein [Jatrophihabitans telluris]UQX90211.1 DUF58 domain-containing protein [Jatrophihabitans telluris]